MSRRDSPSLNIRGVPRELLDRLDAAAAGSSRDAVAIGLLERYAAGELVPASAPPPFDPTRRPAVPHGDDTAPLAISGIPAATMEAVMARARRDGWFSKNALIVELLRTL